MKLVRVGCKSSSRKLLHWVSNNADCFHNPKRNGLSIAWYDGLPSPSNFPWTDLEVRRTALTQ
jgi:hypothetical protein